MMNPTTLTSRTFQAILIWGMVAFVVGMPLVCLAADCSLSNLVATEKKKSSDGESDGFDWELLELLALPGEDTLPEFPVHPYHGADELTETVSALSDPHFERGPPCC